MGSRLLVSGNWLNTSSRTQPWLCAQCAQFSSSAVALKPKGRGQTPGRRGGARGSSRTQLRKSHFQKYNSCRFLIMVVERKGTTSRTRLVKDLKPKLGTSSPLGVKTKGKFEVAPRKTKDSASQQDGDKQKVIFFCQSTICST